MTAVFANAETIERRRAICERCPHRKEIARLRLHRCEKCGCPIYAKVRVAAATCPDNRW